MQLENSFTVPVPIDEAWRVLLDIERIAPCMPGAALDSVDGDDFTGRVKVKLGPINLTYQGKASFIEKDEAAHKAVIDARGKDQRGNGTAAAVVTARLAAEGSITRVDVLTDLNITGRPAQFGRGVMTDVGNKLLGQFADKLAAQLGEGDAQGDADRAAAAEESAAQKAAATASGAVEEVAASAEQAAGNGAGGQAVKKAAAGAKKTAAAATDKVSGSAEPAPAKKAAPAKKTAAAKTAPVTAVPPLEDSAPAAADTAPAAADTAPAAKAPSGPPGGPTAPPSRPATGAPVRSVPSAGPRTVPKPQEEPEPIDLLEVAGGAAMARYAAPAAGIAGVVLVIVLLARRRRRRR
ncbi:SRPBCC family protein [Blastococcus tunisiensis]|uniref:Carbon monoxide dehydrogenase subunit G n=1 Tax=Blastococcus tunisiensis TaxID=1798228 RepID=A0A1I2H375_9ACTN|nr:SRPBCC family protein [Blastococcus sp. DSM 46838]SFF23769.1 Carbon monoxide dehydrogenase subunit G [Blastococcus sp. DSM 46838]